MKHDQNKKRKSKEKGNDKKNSKTTVPFFKCVHAPSLLNVKVKMLVILDAMLSGHTVYAKIKNK